MIHDLICGTRHVCIVLWLPGQVMSITLFMRNEDIAILMEGGSWGLD